MRIQVFYFLLIIVLVMPWLGKWSTLGILDRIWFRTGNICLKNHWDTHTHTHTHTHTPLWKKQRSKSQGRWLTALRFQTAFRKSGSCYAPQSATARNQSLPMVTVACSTKIGISGRKDPEATALLSLLPFKSHRVPLINRPWVRTLTAKDFEKCSSQVSSPCTVERARKGWEEGNGTNYQVSAAIRARLFILLLNILLRKKQKPHISLSLYIYDIIYKVYNNYIFCILM